MTDNIRYQARELLTAIDQAQAYRVTPARPDTTYRRVIADLLAEVEQAEETSDRILRLSREQRDDLMIAEATIERVRELAEGWLTEPCVAGYRIPNGDGDDSQCLHCGADIIFCALHGGDLSC